VAWPRRSTIFELASRVDAAGDVTATIDSRRVAAARGPPRPASDHREGPDIMMSIPSAGLRSEPEAGTVLREGEATSRHGGVDPVDDQREVGGDPGHDPAENRRRSALD
jgi:hypothetical protein